MKKILEINKLINIQNYNKEFADLKNRLKEAQHNAILKVNTEMLLAYFDIGKIISDKLNTKVWGEGVVDNLAEYFKIELPGIKGLNRRNLYYMKSFYERYKTVEFVQELPAQMTWTHNQIILDSTSTIDEAEFYIKLSLNKGYSSTALKEAVKRKELENFKLSQNNFSANYPLIKSSENLIVGDNTNLDFILLGHNHKERELENGIVSNLVKFLSRMGGKMAFVGRQVPVKFTERQYFIDLLFFHMDLNCYIVFELKAEKFKADNIGQLALYLGAVNKEIKKESHSPTIGIILCRDKDRIEVEYILNTINAPIGVSTYTHSQLPEEFAKYLPDIDQIDFADDFR